MSDNNRPAPRTKRYYRCLALWLDILMIATFLVPLILGIYRMDSGSNDANDVACMLFGIAFIMPTILIFMHDSDGTKIANIMNLVFILFIVCITMIATKDYLYLALALICCVNMTFINLPQSIYLNSH